MKVQVLDEATADLADGYRFYERQAEGLGDYFLDSLWSDIHSLRLHGGVHAAHHGYHRLLSKRFPFAVYYRIEDDGPTSQAEAISIPLRFMEKASPATFGGRVSALCDPCALCGLESGFLTAENAKNAEIAYWGAVGRRVIFAGCGWRERLWSTRFPWNIRGASTKLECFARCLGRQGLSRFALHSHNRVDKMAERVRPAKRHSRWVTRAHRAS